LVRPYKEFFVQPQEFLGVGRELPEPKVSSVKIGFLGPLEGSAEAIFGQHMLAGVHLAIEAANAAGGYHGHPFELEVHADKARWGDSSNELVAMYFREQVWGVVGTLSSANAHVMMRATLKMNLPIVNTATTDPTLNEHRIPFGVRCMADDRQFSYALARHLFEERELKWVAMIRVNNRDGRTGVREFVDAARRLGHPLLFEVRFDEGETDFAAQLARIKQSPAQAVVVWGNPREAGLIVKQMRGLGMKQAVVGWFRMVSPEFLKLAGAAAEGVVCAYPYDPTAKDPLLLDFQRRYQQRFSEAPDAFAAHAYDGTGLLIAAIQKAGLNRIKIRDALAEFKSFHGATGEIVFDATHNDIGPVYLAKVVGGQFRF
jgi:ABC-type branched-subunit amino acid transport system substrate-binding protein